MKLRAKVWEKGMAARLKCHDARQVMGFWQRVGHWLRSGIDVPLGPMRGLLTGVLAGIVGFHLDSVIAYPDFWMAGIGLWGLLAAVIRAGMIWNMSQSYPEYRLLWMLPLPPDEIAQRSTRRVILGMTWTFGEFLLLYGAIALSTQHPLMTGAGAAALAELQTGVSLALTLLLVASRLNLDRIVSPVFVLVFALISLCLWSNEPLQIIQAVGRLNPLDWVNGLYLHGWIRGGTAALWNIVPAALLLITLPFSLRAVRRLHREGAFRSNQIQMPVRFWGQ